MIRPPALKTGDQIAIISTARKIAREEVEPAKELFSNWGLNVFDGTNLYEGHDQFAGTDEQRLSDLQQALNNPNIKAIVCARGGYGTARLLDRVDWSAFSQSPKWLVGYSDITALLMHSINHFGVEGVHGTMPINISRNPDEAENQSVSSLKNLLFGGEMSYELPEHSLTRKGDSEGRLLGGNLSMIYSLLGSNSLPSFENAILFLEDLDEYLYHVDRMVLNLKRNGIFDKISGLVIGGMSDMNDNTVPFGKTAEEIIVDNVSSYGFPVYFGLQAGHISPNLALPFGRKVRIINDKLTSA